MSAISSPRACFNMMRRGLRLVLLHPKIMWTAATSGLGSATGRTSRHFPAHLTNVPVSRLVALSCEFVTTSLVVKTPYWEWCVRNRTDPRQKDVAISRQE